MPYRCIWSWQCPRCYGISITFCISGTDPEGIKKHAHEVWMRHWKFFTTGELMRVPKVDGKFRGLRLPKTVVDKIYYSNAQKWIPGIVKGN